MGHAPGLFGHIGQRGGLHEPDIVVGLRKFTLTDLAQQDVLFEIRRFLAGESIEGIAFKDIVSGMSLRYKR